MECNLHDPACWHFFEFTSKLPEALSVWSSPANFSKKSRVLISSPRLIAPVSASIVFAEKETGCSHVNLEPQGVLGTLSAHAVFSTCRRLLFSRFTSSVDGHRHDFRGGLASGARQNDVAAELVTICS